MRFVLDEKQPSDVVKIGLRIDCDGDVVITASSSHIEGGRPVSILCLFKRGKVYRYSGTPKEFGFALDGDGQIIIQGIE